MFDQNDDDDVYEEISVIHGRIEQEEFIEYKADYCEVNYECENIRDVDCIKLKPYLIDSGYIVCEIIEEQKAESYEIIEDQTRESYELTEGQKVEYCETTEQKKDKKFSKNGLKYKEIKKLMLVITKKECSKMV